MHILMNMMSLLSLGKSIVRFLVPLFCVRMRKFIQSVCPCRNASLAHCNLLSSAFGASSSLAYCTCLCVGKTMAMVLG